MVQEKKGVFDEITENEIEEMRRKGDDPDEEPIRLNGNRV